MNNNTASVIVASPATVRVSPLDLVVGDVVVVSGVLLKVESTKRHESRFAGEVATCTTSYVGQLRADRETDSILLRNAKDGSWEVQGNENAFAARVVT